MVSGAGRLAGVVGWPVRRSLSPRLHNAWIAAAGLDAVYVPFPIEPDAADRALRALPDLGVCGVNVTAPHKVRALAVADQASDAAARLGAANLLVFRGGSIIADNTDVTGFRLGLAEQGMDMPCAAFVLGAGGAARAALHALQGAGCARIDLTARTREAALAVAAELDPDGRAIRVVDWPERENALAAAELIVNATSAGMAGAPALDLPLAGAARGAMVYDLVYSPLETPLLAAAKAHGLKTVDGLGMLIGQARPSFEALFGVPPPPQVDARALLQAALEATQ